MSNISLNTALEKYYTSIDANKFKFKFISNIVMPIILADIDYLPNIFQAIVKNKPFSSDNRLLTIHIVLNQVPQGEILIRWNKVIAVLKEMIIDDHIEIKVKMFDMNEHEDFYFRNRESHEYKEYLISHGNLPEYGMKSGPNLMFFNIIKYSIEEEMQAFLMMEVDCLPLREDWLGLIEKEISENYYDQYVFGSPYRGIGALHSRYRNHLNGNAVYLCGDPSFQIYYDEVVPILLKICIKNEPGIAYDVINEIIFYGTGAKLPAEIENQLLILWPIIMKKLMKLDSIVNVGGKAEKYITNEKIIKRACEKYPDAVFIHGIKLVESVL